MVSCNAFDVLAQIVEVNPSIEGLTLVSYMEKLNWRDLTQSQGLAELDALIVGTQQDRGERALRKIVRTEATAARLRCVAEELPKEQLLGVFSKVSLVDGGTAHIPMMDFSCVPSDRNLELLKSLLKSLGGGKGFLLESGKSYHYYGTQILDEEGWRIFLGKCLLMSDHSDSRYIGHQLIDGHCVLRLSAGKLKQMLPKLVTVVV